MNYQVAGQNWIVTEQLNAGRILSKGQITVANATFSLDGMVPFSLFLNPKADGTNITFVVSVQLQQDATLGNLPFNIGCWTEPSIIVANITSGLLADYDVFWGAGQKIGV